MTRLVLLVFVDDGVFLDDFVCYCMFFCWFNVGVVVIGGGFGFVIDGWKQ